MMLATLATAALASNTTKFTQLQCQDSDCLLCDVYVFAEGNCNTAQSGFTAKGFCLPSGVFQQQLWDNVDCTGTPFSVTNIPLNTCVQSVGDTYFEDICDTNLQHKSHYNTTVNKGSTLLVAPSLSTSNTSGL
eukprot:TRINITY_DN5245_c1_g1_i1.p1 TRINITY_DN5245_c1_g1~~TRINITY_DN5245_c1_g1_i1.p1  ORF type:complete len:133 (+),score=22.31 TRINITY_DN5245_c1_g1_i1:74-472(+)